MSVLETRNEKRITTKKARKTTGMNKTTAIANHNQTPRIIVGQNDLKNYSIEKSFCLLKFFYPVKVA
ncbi:MAG: hypothetical protein ONA90_03720 [candidate division KSB1 bacterium]|nr:hypothetical protein [candidate division KSB1 bacterium]